MKFLLSANPQWPLENAKSNNMQLYNVSFDTHPALVEKQVKKFLEQIESGLDCGLYTTNNLLAMLSLPEDCFLWVDKINDSFVITPFWEVFSAFKGLKISDVYVMACLGRLPRDKQAESEGKVKYLISPLERF